VILAGDIGGTTTRLARFDADLRPGPIQTWPSREQPGLTEIVRSFRAGDAVAIESACFGVAGPVRDGRYQTTNLPWTVDVSRLRAVTATDRVSVVNDLEAMAWGLDLVAVDQRVVLQEGDPSDQGNSCLIAAGTGLGEAGLSRAGGDMRPFATEGGHADFATRDDVDCALLRDLARTYGHVSWERVLSGPGLHDIDRFLRRRAGAAPPEWLEHARVAGDPAAAIAEAALAGSDEIASQALDRFVTYLGAEAGNLALKTLATRGVYVAGGIAPKILARLQEGPFLRAFADKGRMRPILAAMPVIVIIDELTALRGAARAAARALTQPAQPSRG